VSGKKRILLVDDDKEFIEGTKDLLEAHGYEVLKAHTGAQGLEMAKKSYPNLMILDVMMTTDTEGFDVSRKIEESPELKGLPVILMTGIKKAMGLPFSFEPDEDWLPVKAVLDKPVAPDKLLAEIAKHAT
jgi:CheY-like chemotaxis protein